ncbi:MAG TPA: transcriptional repressor [Victivallales bacterium]|nr:transcriptional repressor [Victivallales bacterium]HPO89831.1 transcriptional repressor [Victivallales bacterium]HRR06279.1 transcriptional repressor [Victivallales bacterium]HRR28752.1 transcriptional repressor [Victivallales bacterium]HRU01954.1 transcriptional repressor [Victivallales bacterium]
MRLTKQRKVIIDYLRSLKNHPTADDLFQPLKKRLPSMSLGSLYRNLDVLTKSGIITKLESFGETKRYDGNIEEHFHFQCIKCGSVSDYENQKLYEIRKNLSSILPSSPTITSLSIDLKGICEKCKRTINKKNGV